MILHTFGDPAPDLIQIDSLIVDRDEVSLQILLHFLGEQLNGRCPLKKVLLSASIDMTWTKYLH
jgi:hypothetical protein